MHTSNGPGLAQILIFTLLGSIVAAVNACLVALISASHAWGIVSLVSLLAIAYWIVQSTKFILRKARVNSTGLGTMMVLAMMVCYVLAEAQVSAILMGTDLPGFYVSRWQSGLPLFGAGSWALSGWFWAVCYVLKVLLLLVLFYGAAADEGDRPFCEDCGTATTQPVWKQPVGRFDLDYLKEFARGNGQWDIQSLMTDLHQDPNGKGAVLIRLWSCNCRTKYEFKAEVFDLSAKMAGSEIVGFLPMSATSVSRVVQWVWSIDPEAEIPETVLKVYEENPPPEPTHTPE